MKICQACSIKKPLTEFHQKKGRNRQPRCKDCMRAYQREHYKKNKEQYAKRNRNTLLKTNKFIYEYLLKYPCPCGEKDPACLDFDHLRDKKQNLSRLKTYGMGTVKREIAKCQVICSNCHRKKTAKEQKWYDWTGQQYSLK